MNVASFDVKTNKRNTSCGMLQIRLLKQRPLMRAHWIFSGLSSCQVGKDITVGHTASALLVG